MSPSINIGVHPLLANITMPSSWVCTNILTSQHKQVQSIDNKHLKLGLHIPTCSPSTFKCNLRDIKPYSKHDNGIAQHRLQLQPIVKEEQGAIHYCEVDNTSYEIFKHLFKCCCHQLSIQPRSILVVGIG